MQEKDIRNMFDLDSHYQYLVHVEAVNEGYTQRITEQVEEWSGKVMYPCYNSHIVYFYILTRFKAMVFSNMIFYSFHIFLQ